jgi:RimJ/RimL family protein N-acetyltransferase
MNPILLDIPAEIATERLILRAPRQGGGAIILPAVRASLPELKKWMPWASDDYDLKNAEEWCRRNAAKFLSREELAFLIFSKQGDHLGSISAFRFDWNVPRCEIGYWLSTAHCGRGLMTEAVTAVTKLALDLLKCERVEIRTDARNDRSRRVAELAGFSLEGVLRNECRDVEGKLRNTAILSRVS